MSLKTNCDCYSVFEYLVATIYIYYTESGTYVRPESMLFKLDPDKLLNESIQLFFKTIDCLQLQFSSEDITFQISENFEQLVYFHNATKDYTSKT